MQQAEIQQIAMAVFEDIEALEKTLASQDVSLSIRVADATNRLDRIKNVLAPLTRLQLQ